MADPAEIISCYLQAKDCNRPWMMQKVFKESACLQMENASGAISFPSDAVGVDEISRILVRQFALENENVYTVCLSAAPVGRTEHFNCDWLVAMSRRDTGEVRVGSGQYSWAFEPAPHILANYLKISIEVMVLLAEEHSESVMVWMSGLSHPWCSVSAAHADIPDLHDLKPISDFLNARTKH